MDKLEGADGGPHTGVSFRSDQSPPLPSPPTLFSGLRLSPVIIRKPFLFFPTEIELPN